METRIEKYKLYRNEIKNKQYIISQINSKNTKITMYKKKIDDISEKILDNFFIPEHIVSFYSIDQNDEKSVNEIKGIISNIDTKDLDNIQKKIYEITESNLVSKKFSIYDSSGKFNNDWLEKYEDYQKFNEEIKIFLFKRTANLNSEESILNINVDQYANDNIDIKNIKVQDIKKSDETKKNKWIYYGIGGTTAGLIIMLLLTVILKIEFTYF